MKEQELIQFIRERAPVGEGVRTGIGDDAAVVEVPGGEPVVITTDLLLEGIHFGPDATPEELGWKALAVSVSDVAAMGCRARYGLLAAAFRAELADQFATRLLEGAASLARATGLSLVGGDTTESMGPLALCSTVVGEPAGACAPVLRSGAAPGQEVLVTGSLGGSLASRHLRFVPRQAEAIDLVSRYDVGAMIDISDGLSTDARHLARESGVRIRLYAETVPLSEAARTAADGAAPLTHALNDGEDFELLFTVAPEDALAIARDGLAGTPVTRIGEVLAGEAEVTLVHENGEEKTLVAGGFEHFG